MMKPAAFSHGFQAVAASTKVRGPLLSWKFSEIYGYLWVSMDVGVVESWIPGLLGGFRPKM